MKAMRNGMQQQRGVALAVGLMLLLVLTVIGLGAMRSSVLEYQMARNEESRISSFQRAQSLIDAAIDDTDNLVVSGQVGDVYCLAKDVGVNSCGSGNGTVQLSGNLVAAPYDTRSSVFIKRFGPLPDGLVPAPRGLGFDVDFRAAQFEVSGSYDASSVKQGRSALAQGVMIIVSAAQ